MSVEQEFVAGHFLENSEDPASHVSILWLLPPLARQAAVLHAKLDGFDGIRRIHWINGRSVVPIIPLHHNRRMTRLTNAFSKKAENHAHMMAIYFMHYNFVRLHQTLKVTPAMAAGVTPKLWEMADMVAVLEDWETAIR